MSIAREELLDAITRKIVSIHTTPIEVLYLASIAHDVRAEKRGAITRARMALRNTRRAK